MEGFGNILLSRLL